MTALSMLSSPDAVTAYVRERLAAGVTVETATAEVASAKMVPVSRAAEMVAVATDETAKRRDDMERERRARREAKRTADIAELRRVSTPRSRTISDDDPSVHGSHLLGHEGERFPR